MGLKKFFTCGGRLSRKQNGRNRKPKGKLITGRLPKTVKKVHGEKFASKRKIYNTVSAPSLRSNNNGNLRQTASTGNMGSKKRGAAVTRAKPMFRGQGRRYSICTRFKDYLTYKWIRFKVWFRAKNKADVLDTLTYDPFTGEPVLTGSEKPTNEVEEEGETEVKCLAYSAELHNSLRYFWWSINFTGRLPFRVQMEDLDLDDGVLDTLIIRMDDWSAIIINIVTCVILWILLLWALLGHCLIWIDKEKKTPELSSSTAATTNLKPTTPTNNTSAAIAHLEAVLPEYLLLRRYWLELWFFYTTLFHLASVTTNQYLYGKDYALFFKRWYKALDRSKVKVHNSLRGFYMKLNGLVLALVILMTCLFTSRTIYPFMSRTCQIILAGYMYPITHRIETDEHRFSENGDLYFQNIFLECVVFVFYCWIVIVSWQNSIIHLTFSRCFRNGIRLLNDRVRMVLLPLEEPEIGPNAIRITCRNVQYDYAHLTAAGMGQNKVFGFAIMSDMMWTLLTLFFEIMALTFYGIADPASPEYLYRFHNNYKGTNIPQMDPQMFYLLNSVGHVVITVLRLWIVVWFPDLVFREAQLGYRSVTSKGLLSCSNQLQRNFVRSLWLMTVPKFPIIISANNYFKLTRGMICALCSAVCTFYIFAMQAKADMSRILLGDWSSKIEDLYAATGRSFKEDNDTHDNNKDDVEGELNLFSK